MCEFRDLMTKNGYDYGYIERIINYVYLNVNCNDFNGRRMYDKVRYFRLPFFNKGSNTLRRVLEDLRPEVKIAFGSINVLRDQVFSKVKDRTPLQDRSGLVYLGVYVGETEQHLKKRIASHRFDLIHVDKDRTALAAHKKHTGHEIDLSNV